MPREDHHTSTVDAAAAWQRYHQPAPDGWPRHAVVDDDRPTRAEAEADERESDDE